LEGEKIMCGSERTSGAIIGKNKAALYYQTREAKGERARLIIVHGLGEHSGRYQKLIDHLVLRGISVWSYDQRGHGMSDGPRGHTDSFDSYVYDLAEMVTMAAEDKPPDRPLFLLAHSMGGLVAVLYALKYPRAVDGMVLSSPALGLPRAAPPLKAAFGKLMSFLWPRLAVSNELMVDKISHDPAVVQAYKDDPLVHGRISVRWFTAFVEALILANKGADRISTPLFMQIAGDDYLVSPAASQNFFNELPDGDKTIRVYEGYYHEIYNEKSSWRDQTVSDLQDWLDERIARTPKAAAP